ncbi:MAG: cytosolic protein [Deltaproteobacteria bacterium]|nr:cytosolic protein [Deltaproteobacteria bacterium]
MEKNQIESPQDLTNEQLAELVILMFHQILVHHGLYFNEAVHQFGMTRALELINNTWKKSCRVQMKRLGKTLGFEVENNIPTPLLNMSRDGLMNLIKSLGANWLASDGIWFQEIESKYTVLDAQRSAGSCVGRYCSVEASTIKEFLGLGEYAGLDGLKKALRFRPYHQINVQSILDESPGSVIFQMNECIVQTTRKKKGLDDYPCKSTGIVEYRSFAQTIDPRITVECLGCPPDDHPEDWYCSWRFILPDDSVA